MNSMLLNIVCIGTFFIGLFYGQCSYGQSRLSLGGTFTMESRLGEEDSRFFYNEIPRSDDDLTLTFRELNVWANWIVNPQFSMHFRFQGRERNGRTADVWLLSRASLRWKDKRNRWSVEAGRILSPFGLFFKRTFPQDRVFITSPLFYSYYINASEIVGFSEGLSEPNELRLEGRNGPRDWGLTQAYDIGYTTGIKGRWNFWPDTAFLDVAIVNGAPMNIRQWSDPFHPAVIARLEVKPTYNWKQGISVAYGGFLQSDAINERLDELSTFRQLLIGTDVTVGYRYVEWSGELIAGRYKLPVFNAEETLFEPAFSDGAIFNTLSGFADMKIELPFFIGSYVAYRFGFIRFYGDEPPLLDREAWDDNVSRHTIAFGYNITRFLLLKTSYAFQEVSNRDWALDHWKSTLTLHF